MRKFTILFSLTLFALFAEAQHKVSLEIQFSDPLEEKVSRQLKYKTSLNDSILVRSELTGLLNQLHTLGYAAASIDSLKFEGETARAFVFVGNAFEWQSLRSGNVPIEMLDQIGFKSKFFANQTFKAKDLKRVQTKLLEYAENHGYPFAKVKLDSLELDETDISGALWMDKGLLITFDTIARKGSFQLGNDFLKGYLGYKPGKPYDERVVKSVSKRIKELTFVDEEQPAFIEFDGKEARLNLFLKNRKTSQFNFLLGFLPNSEISGRFIITGDVLLDLVNPFGTGKQFKLNWKRPKPATQELEVKAAYPYILGLPFGLDGKFELYKRDTLFLDVITELGLQFHFIGGNYLKGFVNNSKSTLLSVDTAQVLLDRELPDDVDVSNTIYGIEYHFEKLNYKLNPVSGVSLRFSTAAGTRKISPNNNITSLNDPENPGHTFETLYDSLKLKSANLKWSMEVDKFWRLNQRNTVFTGLKSGGLVADKLFANELFRIGGTHILRGFDEQSVLASWYNVVTLEYRFLLAENSYYYLFGDFAFVQDKSASDVIEDWPIGFGTGLAFETRAGLFSVGYALGRQQQNPIQFRSAKIHFGYINYF